MVFVLDPEPSSCMALVSRLEDSVPDRRWLYGRSNYHHRYIYSQVLHATRTNKNGIKALIAAEYSGVEIEMAKNFQMGVSNTTPEFLKMNPIGKVENWEAKHLKSPSN